MTLYLELPGSGGKLDRLLGEFGAVAREYGFASWTRLRYEVAARTAGLARQAEAFCEASIRDGTGRAARMLAATPSSPATASPPR